MLIWLDKVCSIEIGGGSLSASGTNKRTASSMGDDLGYNRCWSRRGFRLHPGKSLSVKIPQLRLSCLVRLLSRWRRALRLGICLESRSPSALRSSKWDSKFNSSSRVPLVGEKSYMRSNSFYSEAIEECLEFIKRNSVSAQQSQLLDLKEDRVCFPTRMQWTPDRP